MSEDEPFIPGRNRNKKKEDTPQRRAHATLAPIAFLPLALTVASGMAYTIFQDGFLIYKQASVFTNLMTVHTGDFVPGMKFVYMTAVTLCYLGILFSGMMLSPYFRVLWGDKNNEPGFQAYVLGIWSKMKEFFPELWEALTAFNFSKLHALMPVIFAPVVAGIVLSGWFLGLCHTLTPAEMAKPEKSIIPHAHDHATVHNHVEGCSFFLGIHAMTFLPGVLALIYMTGVGCVMSMSLLSGLRMSEYSQMVFGSKAPNSH